MNSAHRALALGIYCMCWSPRCGLLDHLSGNVMGHDVMSSTRRANKAHPAQGDEGALCGLVGKVSVAGSGSHCVCMCVRGDKALSGATAAPNC